MAVVAKGDIIVAINQQPVIGWVRCSSQLASRRLLLDWSRFANYCARSLAAAAAQSFPTVLARVQRTTQRPVIFTFCTPRGLQGEAGNPSERNKTANTT